MNSMVYEWSIFYQKAKKYLKNDGLTSGGPRVHLAGAPTGQIWDSCSTNVNEKEKEGMATEGGGSEGGGKRKREKLK